MAASCPPPATHHVAAASSTIGSSSSGGGGGGAATLFVNPRHDSAPAEFAASRHTAAISAADVAAARHEVESWAGYAPTPLLPLPSALAAELGVGSIHCKHEGHRFPPVGSFKPTGVVYALARILLQQLGLPAPAADGVAAAGAAEQLLAGGHAAALAEVTVCAATSGNHGRALAWGARPSRRREVVILRAPPLHCY